MLTVSKLARSCGVSRSTVLYYESIGLLKPAPRTAANYRRYGEAEAGRLRQICTYRSTGLTLEDIRAILDGPDSGVSSVLERRLVELSAEIDKIRDHQRAIMRLLKNKPLLGGTEVIDKDKWVSIMRASGFSEDDMHRWHREFERSAPEEHQEFLEFLRIPPDNISLIRERSRQT